MSLTDKLMFKKKLLKKSSLNTSESKSLVDIAYRDSFRFSTTPKGQDGVIFERIMLPDRSFPTESWICASTCDFVDELYIHYTFCKEDYERRFTNTNEGFPQGVIYKLRHQTSGPEYVKSIFDWLIDQIDDHDLFLIDKEVFPSNYKSRISEMFVKMLRVYSIIICVERHMFTANSVQSKSIQESLKHFVFFALYWNLIDFTTSVDAIPLRSHITTLQRQYVVDRKKWNKLSPTDFTLHAETAKKEFEEKYSNTGTEPPKFVPFEWHSEDEEED